MVLAVIVGFPQLGLWQLHRYDEERALADRIEARVSAEPVPLGDVLALDTPAEALDDLEFMPVEVTGRYALDEQVFQRNRAFEGASGFDVLTPLRTGDGEAILVRRGFVPPVRQGAPDPAAAPAVDGEVTVTGYLERSGRQPGFGPRDAEDGRLDIVFHADVERLDRQTSADLLPMVLHLRSQSPSHPDGPVPQPVPEIDASSNLNYAFQWFAFTAIALIGYAIVLYRRVVDQRRGVPAGGQRR